MFGFKKQLVPISYVLKVDNLLFNPFPFQTSTLTLFVRNFVPTFTPSASTNYADASTQT